MSRNPLNKRLDREWSDFNRPQPTPPAPGVPAANWDFLDAITIAFGNSDDVLPSSIFPGETPITVAEAKLKQKGVQQ